MSVMSAKRPYQPLSRSRIEDDRRLAELVQSVSIGSVSLHPLPPENLDFSGRQAEITQAIALRQQLSVRSEAAVISIVGAAGVGKSSFALHLARRLQPQPDAQIYLNLKAVPLSPAAIVQQIQLALGGDLAAIDRPLLLLLDAVEDASQIRPLLGLPHCTILTTSRQPLDLPNAGRIDLPALSMADAIALLQTAGAKTQAEPEVAKAIVSCCDALPLAIRLVGGWYHQPQLQLAEGLQQLREERQKCEQANLSYPAIRACFNLSYRRLDDRSARLLRLLGLLTEPSFTLKTAIALSELPLETTNASLNHLLRLRFLDADKTRYRLPDPLRLLAKNQLAIEESTETRAAARVRLSQTYLETAEVMNLGLNASSRLHLAQRYGTGRSISAFEHHLFLRALSWFEADRSNLFAALDWSMQSQSWRSVLAIVRSLIPYLLLRGDESDWQRIDRSLQAAIDALDDSTRLAVAQTLSDRAQADLQQGDWQQAQERYEHSLKLLDRDLLQAAPILANLGLAQLEQGDRLSASASWSAAIALLPPDSPDRRELVEWMQSIDAALGQAILPQADRPPSRHFLGTIGGMLKRLISDPTLE